MSSAAPPSDRGHARDTGHGLDTDLDTGCDHDTGWTGPGDWLCPTCGEAVSGLPLDAAYTLPEELWELDQDALKVRAELSESLIMLDSERFFVRTLLPIAIADGSEYRFGVWVEVVLDTFRRLIEAWDSPDLYAQLTFTGALANPLPVLADGGLGCVVYLSTRSHDERPYIHHSEHAQLAQLLHAGWSIAAYRDYVLGTI